MAEELGGRIGGSGVQCLHRSFRAIKTPPARKRAHRSHKSALEIKIYWGFKRVLLIKESQRPQWDGSRNSLVNGPAHHRKLQMQDALTSHC
jgi:hypothetical protein